MFKLAPPTIANSLQSACFSAFSPSRSVRIEAPKHKPCKTLTLAKRIQVLEERKGKRMLGTGRAQIVNEKYRREQKEFFADFLKSHDFKV